MHFTCNEGIVCSIQTSGTKNSMKFKISNNPFYKDVYDILDGKHPTFQSNKLKNKLFEAGIKQKVCERCGLDQWFGADLPLELNHINGNSQDHVLSNLEILCPNCHSQTDTYKNKNYGNGRHYRKQRYVEGKTY